MEMSNKKQQIPAIRFNGFTDAWEQRKLGDVFLQTSKYVNPKESNLELWSLTVENGLTPKTARYNREFLVKKEDQFKAVDHNEFIYNPMNMTLGALDLNLTGQTVAVSGYYITMLSKDGYDSKYFSIWLKSPQAIKMYKLYATGSLIERQRVQFPTLSQIKAKVPKIGEQTKIGSFLEKFDHTIALHQRQLNKYSKLKKALLQKMFPKSGEKFPEIRFDGFVEEWKQCKLDQIVIERNQQVPESIDYPLMSFTAMDGVTPKSDRYNREFLVKSDNKKYKKTELGDLIYSSNNLDVGSIGINKTGNAVISPVYSIFYTRDGVTPEFVDMLIQRKDFINKMIQFRQGVVYGQWRIHESDFLKIETRIPSSKEQIKLGSLFKQIDNSIAFHQQKVNDYQKLKGAILKKIFI